MARTLEISSSLEELAVRVETGSVQVNNWRELIALFPAVRAAYQAATLRCLAAEKYYFDRKTMGMVHEPDYQTQLKAAALIASYDEGLPIQSTVNLNVGGGNAAGPELRDALANSPALRRHLAAELAAVEREPKRVESAA